MKFAFSQMLRERRTQYGLSQTDLAKRLQSSQSRVAKMEAGDPKGTIRPWTEVLGLR